MNLPQLSTLSLAYDQLRDANGLMQFPNLQTVYLDDNEITDIGGLGGLTNLQTVSITDNPLDNAAASTIAQLQAGGATVNYTPDPNAPVLSPIAPQGTPINTTITIPLSATDADGDPIFFTYSVDEADTHNVGLPAPGSNLTITPDRGFIGVVQITVTAWDGPYFAGDWRGKSDSQTFDLSVGTAAIYGTVFLDSNLNHKQDPGEPGEPFHVGLYDTSGDLIAGPVTANYNGVLGNYAFIDLPAGTAGTVAVLSPDSPSNGIWTLLNPVSGYYMIPPLTAGQVVTGDNFSELLTVGPLLNQGAQLPPSVPEGTTLDLTATTHDPFGAPGDQFTYFWTTTFNGNPYSYPGTDPTYLPALNNAGIYTITLTVQDFNVHNNVLATYSETAIVTCLSSPPANVVAGSNNGIYDQRRQFPDVVRYRRRSHGR